VREDGYGLIQPWFAFASCNQKSEIASQRCSHLRKIGTGAFLSLIQYDLANALCVVASRLGAEYWHHSHNQKAMGIDGAFGDSTVDSKPVLEFGNSGVDLWRRECCA
jgi:hypothetical protein